MTSKRASVTHSATISPARASGRRVAALSAVTRGVADRLLHTENGCSYDK